MDVIYLDILKSLLECMDGSAAVLFSDGRTTALSTGMAEMVAAGDTVIVDKLGRLAFKDTETQRAFAAAMSISRLSASSPQSHMFAVRSETSRTTAVLQRLTEGTDAGAPDAGPTFLMVLCRQGAVEPVSAELLRQHYGLSNAEAAAVLAIACGDNVAEAADRLEIARTTARNQLAAAMTKIGVGRQAAAVAAVACLVPRLRLAPPKP